MKIYSRVDNCDPYKEFLIPRKGDIKVGETLLHVIIDNVNVEFLVKKIVLENSLDSDKWTEHNDYTFPSSLLNEFIRTPHSI